MGILSKIVDVIRNEVKGTSSSSGSGHPVADVIRNEVKGTSSFAPSTPKTSAKSTSTSFAPKVNASGVNSTAMDYNGGKNFTKNTSPAASFVPKAGSHKSGSFSSTPTVNTNGASLDYNGGKSFFASQRSQPTTPSTKFNIDVNALDYNGGKNYSLKGGGSLGQIFRKEASGKDTDFSSAVPITMAGKGNYTPDLDYNGGYGTKVRGVSREDIGAVGRNGHGIGSLTAEQAYKRAVRETSMEFRTVSQSLYHAGETFDRDYKAAAAAIDEKMQEAMDKFGVESGEYQGYKKRKEELEQLGRKHAIWNAQKDVRDTYSDMESRIQDVFGGLIGTPEYDGYVATGKKARETDRKYKKFWEEHNMDAMPKTVRDFMDAVYATEGGMDGVKDKFDYYIGQQINAANASQNVYEEMLKEGSALGRIWNSLQNKDFKGAAEEAKESTVGRMWSAGHKGDTKGGIAQAATWAWDKITGKKHGDPNDKTILGDYSINDAVDEALEISLGDYAQSEEYVYYGNAGFEYLNTCGVNSDWYKDAMQNASDFQKQLIGNAFLASYDPETDTFDEAAAKEIWEAIQGQSAAIWQDVNGGKVIPYNEESLAGDAYYAYLNKFGKPSDAFNAREGETTAAYIYRLGRETASNGIQGIAARVAGYAGSLAATGNPFAASAVGDWAARIGGAIPLTLSAFGNTYRETVLEGYDEKKAAEYAAMDAGMEFISDIVLGGIGKVGGALTHDFSKKVVGKIASPVGRAIVDMNIRGFSEAAQEYVQQRADAPIRSWILGEDFDFNQWFSEYASDEAIDAAFMGYFTSLILSGPTEIINDASRNINAAQYGKQLKTQGSKAKLIDTVRNANITPDTKRAKDALEEAKWLAEQMANGKIPDSDLNMGKLAVEFAQGGGDLSFLTHPATMAYNKDTISTADMAVGARGALVALDGDVDMAMDIAKMAKGEAVSPERQAEINEDPKAQQVLEQLQGELDMDDETSALTMAARATTMLGGTDVKTRQTVQQTSPDKHITTNTEAYLINAAMGPADANRISAILDKVLEGVQITKEEAKELSFGKRGTGMATYQAIVDLLGIDIDMNAKTDDILKALNEKAAAMAKLADDQQGVANENRRAASTYRVKGKPTLRKTGGNNNGRTAEDVQGNGSEGETSVSTGAPGTGRRSLARGVPAAERADRNGVIPEENYTEEEKEIADRVKALIGNKGSVRIVSTGRSSARLRFSPDGKINGVDITLLTGGEYFDLNQFFGHEVKGHLYVNSLSSEDRKTLLNEVANKVFGEDCESIMTQVESLYASLGLLEDLSEEEVFYTVLEEMFSFARGEQNWSNTGDPILSVDFSQYKAAADALADEWHLEERAKAAFGTEAKKETNKAAQAFKSKTKTEQKKSEPKQKTSSERGTAKDNYKYYDEHGDDADQHFKNEDKYHPDDSPRPYEQRYHEYNIEVRRLSNGTYVAAINRADAPSGFVPGVEVGRGAATAGEAMRAAIDYCYEHESEEEWNKWTSKKERVGAEPKAASKTEAETKSEKKEKTNAGKAFKSKTEPKTEPKVEAEPEKAPAPTSTEERAKLLPNKKRKELRRELRDLNRELRSNPALADDHEFVQRVQDAFDHLREALNEYAPLPEEGTDVASLVERVQAAVDSDTPLSEAEFNSIVDAINKQAETNRALQEKQNELAEKAAKLELEETEARLAKEAENLRKHRANHSMTKKEAEAATKLAEIERANAAEEARRKERGEVADENQERVRVMQASLRYIMDEYNNSVFEMYDKGLSAEEARAEYDRLTEEKNRAVQTLHDEILRLDPNAELDISDAMFEGDNTDTKFSVNPGEVVDSSKYRLYEERSSRNTDTKADVDNYISMAGVGILGISKKAPIRLILNRNDANVHFASGPAEVQLEFDNVDKVIYAESFFYFGEKGQGTGVRFIDNLITIAKKAGYKRIECDAARYDQSPVGKLNGYYTWPRLGFDGPLSDRDIRRAKAAGLDATRVSDLMATPEGRAWWKENGQSINVSFDLTDGSYSMNTFEEYKKLRNELEENRNKLMRYSANPNEGTLEEENDGQRTERKAGVRPSAEAQKLARQGRSFEEEYEEKVKGLPRGKREEDGLINAKAKDYFLSQGSVIVEEEDAPQEARELGDLVKRIAPECQVTYYFDPNDSTVAAFIDGAKTKNDGGIFLNLAAFEDETFMQRMEVDEISPREAIFHELGHYLLFYASENVSEYAAAKLAIDAYRNVAAAFTYDQVKREQILEALDEAYDEYDYLYPDTAQEKVVEEMMVDIFAGVSRMFEGYENEFKEIRPVVKQWFAQNTNFGTLPESERRKFSVNPNEDIEELMDRTGEYYGNANEQEVWQNGLNKQTEEYNTEPIEARLDELANELSTADEARQAEIIEEMRKLYESAFNETDVTKEEKAKAVEPEKPKQTKPKTKQVIPKAEPKPAPKIEQAKPEAAPVKEAAFDIPHSDVDGPFDLSGKTVSKAMNDVRSKLSRLRKNANQSAETQQLINGLSEQYEKLKAQVSEKSDYDKVIGPNEKKATTEAKQKTATKNAFTPKETNKKAKAETAPISETPAKIERPKMKRGDNPVDVKNLSKKKAIEKVTAERTQFEQWYRQETEALAAQKISDEKYAKEYAKLTIAYNKALQRYNKQIQFLNGIEEVVKEKATVVKDEETQYTPKTGEWWKRITNAETVDIRRRRSDRNVYDVRFTDRKGNTYVFDEVSPSRLETALGERLGKKATAKERLASQYDSATSNLGDWFAVDNTKIEPVAKTKAELTREKDSFGKDIPLGMAAYMSKSKVRDEAGRLKRVYKLGDRYGINSNPNVPYDVWAEKPSTMNLLRGMNGAEAYDQDGKRSGKKIAELLQELAEHPQYPEQHKNAIRNQIAELEQKNREYVNHVTRLDPFRAGYENPNRTDIAGGKSLLECFVDIRNPLVIDAKGAGLTYVYDQANKLLEDEANQTGQTEPNGDPVGTYDGIKATNVKVTENNQTLGGGKLDTDTIYITFRPNQGKSSYNTSPTNSTLIAYSVNPNEEADWDYNRFYQYGGKTVEEAYKILDRKVFEADSTLDDELDYLDSQARRGDISSAEYQRQYNKSINKYQTERAKLDVVEDKLGWYAITYGERAEIDPDNYNPKTNRPWGDDDIKYSVNPNEDVSDLYPEGTLQHAVLSALRDKDYDHAMETLASYLATFYQTGVLPKLEDVKSRNIFNSKMSKAEQEIWMMKAKEMAQRYGRLEQGENPARDVAFPKKTEQGNIRRVFRSAAESKHTPERAVPLITRESMIGESATYQTITDKSAIAAASRDMSKKGFDKVLAEWEAKADGDIGYNTITKYDIAKAEMLYIEAVKLGDMDTAMRVLAELAEVGTTAGQTVQAMRMLKTMPKSYQLYYMQRVVNRMNRQFAKRINSGRMSELVLNGDLVRAVMRAQTQEDIDKAMEKLIQNLAAQIPATLADKWNAWRYLAMLGNPKTHLRNIAGNGIFMPVVFAKDLVDAGLETIFIRDRSKRRSSIKGVLVGTLGSKHLSSIKAFAAEDFKGIKKELQSGGKYNPSNDILDRRTIWKHLRGLEALRKKNGKALEGEDGAFLKIHYIAALTNFLITQGVTVEQLRNPNFKPGQKILNAARAYAFNEAQKATYRDANRVASALNQMKKNSGLAGSVLLEGMIPFTKTPLNILRRGVEYSPIGLLTTATVGLAKLKNGEITGSEFIDGISSGLTGTGVAILGFWLSGLGLLKGGDDDDDKKEDFEKLQGYQNYSITFNGVNYTIDWMAPGSLPLFVGCEIANELKDGNGELSKADWLNAMTVIAEPITQLSMLSGLNDALKSAKWDDNPVSALAETMASGYVTQALPTLLAQISRSMVADRRTTYVDKNSDTPDAIQRWWQTNVLGKTPLNAQRTEYVDAWGRKDTKPNFVFRLMENMFSPGYINRIKTTSVDEELMRLSEATGSGVLMTVPERTIEFNHETHHLTAEQYQLYAKTRGDQAMTMLDELFNSAGYKAMTDEEKANAVDRIKDYATILGKQAVFPEYTSDSDNWAEKCDGDPTRITNTALFRAKAKSAGVDINTTAAFDFITQQSWLSPVDQAYQIAQLHNLSSTKYVYYGKKKYAIDKDAKGQISEQYRKIFPAYYLELVQSDKWKNANAEQRTKLLSDCRADANADAKGWLAYLYYEAGRPTV